ncbi:unnamed protein product [Leuciscus chuanchicus]
MAERLERLILAVSECRFLYDLSDEGYRDTNRKSAAWRKVAEEVDMSVEEVKKKWRDLRDAFVRYRREDQSRRVSGAAASQKRPWRYAQIMSFLLPFITPRRTTSNLTETEVESQEGEGETQEGEGESQEGEEREGENQEREGENQERERVMSVRPREIESTPDLSGERRRRRRVVSSPSAFEQRIATAIESANTPQEKEPDQAFLDSLLPALKWMSLQKNAATKLKIHQLIYEAEFELLWFIFARERES